MSLPEKFQREYIHYRKLDVEQITASLSTGDWPTIERIGHQIKGNAAMFAHPELGPVGANLEIASKNHDHDTVSILCDELRNWVQEHDRYAHP